MSILPPGLSRQERQAMIRKLERDNTGWPETMVQVAQEKWPKGFLQDCVDTIVGLHRSRHFLAQVFATSDGYLRLAVTRTMCTPNGERWLDGITWDELMRVKAECGYGECWAVEVYPANSHVVNIANVRHLFLLAEAPAYAWKREA